MRPQQCPIYEQSRTRAPRLIMIIFHDIPVAQRLLSLFLDAPPWGPTLSLFFALEWKIRGKLSGCKEFFKRGDFLCKSTSCYSPIMQNKRQATCGQRFYLIFFLLLAKALLWDAASALSSINHLAGSTGHVRLNKRADFASNIIVEWRSLCNLFVRWWKTAFSFNTKQISCQPSLIIEFLYRGL